MIYQDSIAFGQVASTEDAAEPAAAAAVGLLDIVKHRANRGGSFIGVSSRSAPPLLSAVVLSGLGGNDLSRGHL
jgi:hypothetical protein